MIWTIPEPSGQEVMDFAKRLGCTWIGSVRVQPQPSAAACCCHENVRQHVGLVGGEAVLGYYFATFGDTDRQAILHTVWRDHCGDLIDITPFDDDRYSNTFATLGEGVMPLRSAFDRALPLYQAGTTGPMFYVYMLMDPRTNQPFYVGKGTGRRAQTHLWEISRDTNAYKTNLIRAIRRAGLEPEIKIVVEDILDETLAYDIEASLIQRYGRKGYEEGGILVNVCLDNRPPSHRGRTYEEIYGADGAEAQRAKRTALQVARGGYGPKKHSEATRALMKITNAGERNGRFGKPVSEATRAKIGDGNRGRAGALNTRSVAYILRDPEGEEHRFHGWAEVIAFCKARDLSYGTFWKMIQDGWPPARRGKNVGWLVFREGEEEQVAAEPRWLIAFPDGRVVERQGYLNAICVELGISYDAARKKIGERILKGPSAGVTVSKVD